ncbi:hypothetical protein TELCIR_00985 [Teladorsagia circumcincta]|uniref:FAM192A/Fyv6 N-terminal domain-containing protein n=1 Tax=Teladorsagia circumcincta TaxID=45464 RepID=A0A2G9V365_TELCI|nr:hypothetical protein TELCIR_00985 [Teladorsagia circumcincta]
MSSGFVSSEELEEQRRRRQEEWERVRKPEDPKEAPEPEVCNKSLYEQLRDNKEAKQAEIDEAKKFSRSAKWARTDDGGGHVDRQNGQGQTTVMGTWHLRRTHYGSNIRRHVISSICLFCEQDQRRNHGNVDRTGAKQCCPCAGRMP